MKRMPVTRMYRVRAEGGWGWARIWLTDDGCISIMRDYGNYGHWFDSPGREFRDFLTGVSEGYITDKLAYGSRSVIRAEESERRIRKQICEWRREKILTRERARDEWDLIEEYRDLDDVCSQVHWYEETSFNDAHELLVFERESLPRVREFVKQVWPAFVELLLAERELEQRELVDALIGHLPNFGHLVVDPEVQALIAW